MNKNIAGLRTTIYRVADINAAKMWYAKAFQTQPYFDEPFYVGFDIDGYELGLQPEEEPTHDKTESVVAFWGVEDVGQVYNRLIEVGATAWEEPKDVGGNIVVAKVRDPWKNIIGLIYNPHFKVT